MRQRDIESPIPNWATRWYSDDIVRAVIQGANTEHADADFGALAQTPDPMRNSHMIATSRRDLLGMISTPMLISSCSAIPSRNPEIEIGISWPSLSMDGQKIAITVQKAIQPTQIMIIDRAGNFLGLVPNPPGKELRMPAFSPDGRSLVATSVCISGCEPEHTSCDIVIIDLENGNIRPVVSGVGYRGQPAFSPNGRRIVYCHARFIPYSRGIIRPRTQWGPGIRGISEYDLSTNSNTVMLEDSTQHGFTSMGRISVTRENSIFFSATAPYRADIEELLPYRTAEYGYRLDQKNSPKILLDLLTPNYEISGLTVSVDGKNLIFLDLVARLTREYAPSRQMFLHENRVRRQLTNIQTRIADPSISSDGNSCVFIAKVSRSPYPNVVYIDLKSGAFSILDIPSSAI